MAGAVSSATYQCLACPPGHISSAGGGCTACRVGSYSPGIGMTSCEPIPGGQMCLTGYDEGCIDITPCKENTYRPAGDISNSCTSCPPGFESPSGSTSASDCTISCDPYDQANFSNIQDGCDGNNFNTCYCRAYSCGKWSEWILHFDFDSGPEMEGFSCHNLCYWACQDEIHIWGGNISFN